MKMMILAGIALLTAAMNVQAVGPYKATNETQSAAVKGTQDLSYKVKPIVPLWQKSVSANAAGQAPVSARPYCPGYHTQETCEAQVWCVWLDDHCEG